MKEHLIVAAANGRRDAKAAIEEHRVSRKLNPSEYDITVCLTIYLAQVQTHTPHYQSWETDLRLAGNPPAKCAVAVITEYWTSYANEGLAYVRGQS